MRSVSLFWQPAVGHLFSSHSYSRLANGTCALAHSPAARFLLHCSTATRRADLATTDQGPERKTGSSPNLAPLKKTGPARCAVRSGTCHEVGSAARLSRWPKRMTSQLVRLKQP